MDQVTRPENERQAEALSVKEGPKEHKEIRESREIEREAKEVFETVEGKEQGAEMAEGRISEEISEQKKKAPAGKFPAVMTADEIEAIRAKLLQNLPSQEAMVRQIKNTLRKEEKSLNGEYRKLRRMGHKAAYKMNIVVAKLRRVREFFHTLVNATFEIIKQLWLKIVHGV